jgi:uncharacterized protein
MKELVYAKDRLPGAISPYLPDFVADDIADVDFALLKKMGVTHIMLDLDQTLRKPYSKRLEAEVIEIFRNLHDKKIFKDIAIVSNNSRRLARYADPIGALVFQPFWHKGRFIRKPNPLFFTRVLQELNIKPEQAIMIGDKIRTDVRGAHGVGIRTVLIKPRGRDYWYDRLILYRWREGRHYRQLLESWREKLRHHKK